MLGPSVAFEERTHALLPATTSTALRAPLPSAFAATAGVTPAVAQTFAVRAPAAAIADNA
jgi:hypothetical protein